MMEKFEELKRICQEKKELDQEILMQELEFIKEKNLLDEFYKLYKDGKTGKENKVNSLVAYALGITNKKSESKFSPYKRLKSSRLAPPDIDVDFTDVRRDEVIAYVKQKYGEEHVAQIITFGTMMARAAVRDAGRALGLPYDFCDRIAKLILFNAPLKESLETVPELKKMYDENPDAKKIIGAALRLEGTIRHASVHACGVVISEEPLTNVLPLQYAPQGSSIILTQFEMYSIADLGVLKMDFLGLKNLTIIEKTLRLVKEIYNKEIDINNLPLEDKEAFKLFQSGETTGLFQLECLSGETIISNTTLKKLYQKKHKNVLESVYIDEGKVHKNRIKAVKTSGVKDIYIMIAENDWYIKSTKDHYFLTSNGWKKLEDIQKGDSVLIKTKAKHLIYNTCNSCGKQINGQNDGESNFCYSCSASFYRNPSKKESREKIREHRLNFYLHGGKPWNYGATKENNPIIQKTGRKISVALSGKTLEQRCGAEKARQIKENLSRKFKGENNPMFGKPTPHSKRGYREDLKHFVRSNWEADFARILKFFNVKYEYEPQTFRLIKPNGEIINYTPDFYVKSTNTFYEIKGWLHDLDKEKMELFKQQYSQYNFILINNTLFAELSLKYKNLVAWECPRIPLERSFRFIKVKAIHYVGTEETYDIIMEAPGNNLVANGFVVHNSSGMRRYLKELKPTELEDIIAMISLYRPGPMELIPSYINRKLGKEPIKYIHPKLEPILKNTYGVGVYQEQMMRIARDLAGFTLAEADTLRKAIGKKIKELLEEQKEKLVKGMMQNNIAEKTAEQIWEMFPPFARYGFNRSHAASYALISYQTAYLKSRYPTEFMTSLLNIAGNDIERINFLINETRRLNIQVLPPDINQSFETFAVDTSMVERKSIRFGLLAIKNIGLNIVTEIIQERGRGGPYSNLTDFLSRIHHRDLNKKSLESLFKCGAFDSFGIERGQALANIEDILKFNQAAKKLSVSNQNNLFGPEALKNSLRLKPSAPAQKQIALKWEKELLGLYITDHPFNAYVSKIQNIVKPIRDNLNLAENTFSSSNLNLKIAGIVSAVQKILTRNGQPMLFVTVEDLTDKMEILVFADTLSKNSTIWEEGKAVLVHGRLSQRDHEPKLICNEAKEL